LERACSPVKQSADLPDDPGAPAVLLASVAGCVVTVFDDGLAVRIAVQDDKFREDAVNH
jgi:hypothetical protein